MNISSNDPYIKNLSHRCTRTCLGGPSPPFSDAVDFPGHSLTHIFTFSGDVGDFSVSEKNIQIVILIYIINAKVYVHV